MILYGLNLSDGNLSFLNVSAFVVSIILSFFVYLLFNFALNLISFWNYRIYMLYTISEDLLTFGNYPVRIFARLSIFCF